METWKEIPGWEGYYAASSEGRIKRLAGSPRCKTDRVLNPMTTKYGYDTVGLVKTGHQQRPLAVHRLVLEAFYGTAPSDKHQGNHKNGNKRDNRPENLEWVTRAENIAHAYRTGLHGRYFGSRASAAKLTESQVAEILQRIANREYRKNLAAEFRISKSMIDEIVSGDHWRHVPRPDMSNKRRGRHILTEDKVREIKQLLGTMSCSAIGERYGVTSATVWHIKDGRTWTHVR